MMFRAMLTKEFLLVLRDRHALAALFILPAIFILIMSVALRDTFGSARPLLHYQVIDEDHSSDSGAAIALLSNDKALNKAPAKSTFAGSHFLLTIPAGFAAQMGKNQPSAPLFTLTAPPDVKQETLTIFKTELALIALRLRLKKIRNEMAGFLPPAADQPSDLSHLVEVKFQNMAAHKRPTSTQQSVPAWIIFGMFFVVIPMSTIFINERRQNTLTRLITMNISIPVLFAGKAAPYILINQLQVWLMIGVGIFIVPLFGGAALTMGTSISALIMVSCGVSLAAIGTAVLIAVIAGTVEQATTVGGIINILMAALGGVMVPKFIMPPLMRQLASFSPMSWGLDGFLDVFLRGLGPEAVLPKTLALAAFGLGLLIIAGIIFRKKGSK